MDNIDEVGLRLQEAHRQSRHPDLEAVRWEIDLGGIYCLECHEEGSYYFNLSPLGGVIEVVDGLWEPGTDPPTPYQVPNAD